MPDVRELLIIVPQVAASTAEFAPACCRQSSLLAPRLWYGNPVAAEPFADGETVLLLDRGENRRLVRLRAGAKAHGHKGYLEHDRIIGAREGVLVRSSTGATYLVFRPRLVPDQAIPDV